MTDMHELLMIVIRANSHYIGRKHILYDQHFDRWIITDEFGLTFIRGTGYIIRLVQENSRSLTGIN